MSKFGGWVVQPSKNYPQKVASAVAEKIRLFGATYDPAMYLAYQTVNGTNHAVLAQQTITNGEDTNNAVILVFNEKPESMDISLASISTIVENGGLLGGTKVSITTDPSEDLKTIFAKAFDGFTGSGVELQAYIGSKVVKGTVYKYLVTIGAIVPNAEKRLAIMSYNPMTKDLKFETILADDLNGYWILKPNEGTNSLGYSFSWLRVAPNLV